MKNNFVKTHYPIEAGEESGNNKRRLVIVLAKLKNPLIIIKNDNVGIIFGRI